MRRADFLYNGLVTDRSRHFVTELLEFRWSPMPKLQYTLNWTGFPGSPGYSHFIFGYEPGSEGAQVTALRAFLTTWLPHLPNDVSLTLEPTAQVLDDSTGNQIGAATIAPGAPQVGASAGQWSAATGGVMVWHTAVFRNQREVRGRTFMVPLASTAFGTDSGAPLSSLLTSAGAAGSTLASGVPGGMWVQTSQSGSDHFLPVSSATLSPRAAILRSRRD